MSDIAKNTRESLAQSSLFGFSGTGRSTAARRAGKEAGLDLPTDEAAILQALNEAPAEADEAAPAEGSETV
ncbi:MAG: hypothetical protein J0I45_18945 [Bosea sp.]|nr:hypothetical protein [Bosea sp. (in: a-proteobacteria)]